MKKTYIIGTIAIAIIAAASIFFACSKEENDDNFISNKSNKNIEEEDIIIAHKMPTEPYINFDFEVDLIAEAYNQILLNKFDGTMFFDNIYIDDDHPEDYSYEPILALSVFDIETEATYTTFHSIDKELADDGTVFYYTSKQKACDDRHRKITCTGKNCKNENGCSYDREKNDCTECKEGDCTKTDAEADGKIKPAEWIGWGVTVLVALIAFFK